MAAVIIAAITAEESMAEASATKLGATCSIFQYDQRMETYLRATGRSSIADLANEHIQLLTGDAEIEKEVEHDSIKYFDKLIKINLSELEPHVVGPHTPDHARSISQMAEDVKKNGYIDKISVALIGSCTNSSYEDMSRAASIAEHDVLLLYYCHHRHHIV